jgi:hypothetical protein
MEKERSFLVLHVADPKYTPNAWLLLCFSFCRMDEINQKAFFLANIERGCKKVGDKWKLLHSLTLLLIYTEKYKIPEVRYLFLSTAFSISNNFFG